jgi:beta-phosphoglucomutase-like phosphatase (HAD superfamily)
LVNIAAYLKPDDLTMAKNIEISPKAKALIFDIDGTLADTMPAHFKAFRTVLGRYGIDFTPELFQSLAGVPVIPQMVKLKQLFKPEGFDPEKVAFEKEEEYQKTMHEMKPIQPVLDLLLKYHGVMPIGCGTGGDSFVARRTLEIIGVVDKIDAIVSCDDVKNGKPAPDTFLKCAELLKIAPQYCQVFEDGQPGIDAALAAGMMVTDIRHYI